jgi:hypothetical protein
VAGCEDEAQELIAEIVVHGCFDRPQFRSPRAVGRAVKLPRDLLVLALAHFVATDRVDGAAFGRCHQPGAGIGGNTGPRPFGERNDQGVLRQFLCKVEIAYDPGEARDEPRPFNAENRFDRPVSLACGHTALSAKAISEASRPPQTVSGAAELLARPIVDFLSLRRQKLLEICHLV